MIRALMMFTAALLLSGCSYHAAGVTSEADLERDHRMRPHQQGTAGLDHQEERGYDHGH
jgi:hypothetical protein